MSRQSKAAKRKIVAKQFSEIRKAGGKSTNPAAKHGKDWSKRLCNRNSDAYKKMVQKVTKPTANRRGTAGGNAILSGAGAAAR